jgi:hypothetical protein
MTRKLEELFNLPGDSDDIEINEPVTETAVVTTQSLKELDNTIDKIDAALPSVSGLDASDQEMDDLAKKATETFDDLMDLGMQVDSRFAAEIFAVAGQMLGHALTAKTAKLNKKLKMVQLQLQKAKLDLEANDGESLPTAQGQVLSRNDLLERLIGPREQKNKSA